MSFRSPSRWPSFAALAIAIIGLGVGITGWFRPLPHEVHEQAPTAPAYSDQQIANAKTNICAAYHISKNEVFVNTHRSNPVEGDEIGALAVAANGRLALYAGGDYLLKRLATEPATPSNLVDAVKALANLYEEAGIRTLNYEPNSALDPLRHEIDTDIAKIDGLCK
ncbi:hypothetical protein BMW24_008940 [Mycobacterium heckeshornense]|uniref:Uncharacterized protein n=1 Tax=Mycobacterium heckeshornense TaxID=110505 RepID=A0A2G8BBU0_9MYCO|nr:hypothetical protein [Mycobacterium heckeshornense]KMV13912.1 hypothetical protein ACT16_23645 [Mycobacterium heckeshornense]MCV7032638.1 hypothetical protein [Mycobacterium heckeshornense]PIJ35231.1 hypothetical protein BMW24_008940 [Mycobacterium heckeshornense]BCO38087.1 hypothetical protein MHEC_45200 [Mycobacterium heckeshornense]